MGVGTPASRAKLWTRVNRRLLATATNRLVLHVLLLTVAAILVLPLMWAFSASFTPNVLVFKHAYPFTWKALLPTDFTLEAYQILFTRSGFGRAVINTLILALSAVFAGGGISAMAGFAFGRFEFRGKSLLFALVLVAFMIPGEVTVIPLYILVVGLKWLNSWQGLIVPGLCSSLLIFLFRQFFAEFPQEIIDAARVDGASWLRILVRIILPVSQPVLVVAGLLLFLGGWNQFLWPLLIAPKPEFRVVQIFVSYAYQEHGTQWNQLMAGSIFTAAVPILLVVPLQRYYVSAIVGTGLQG